MALPGAEFRGHDAYAGAARGTLAELPPPGGLWRAGATGPRRARQPQAPDVRHPACAAGIRGGQFTAGTGWLSERSPRHYRDPWRRAAAGGTATGRLQARLPPGTDRRIACRARRGWPRALTMPAAAATARGDSGLAGRRWLRGLRRRRCLAEPVAHALH